MQAAGWKPVTTWKSLHWGRSMFSSGHSVPEMMIEIAFPHINLNRFVDIILTFLSLLAFLSQHFLSLSLVCLRDLPLSVREQADLLISSWLVYQLCWLFKNNTILLIFKRQPTGNRHSNFWNYKCDFPATLP